MMGQKNKAYTVSEYYVAHDEKKEVDLDEAIEIAGLGKYNLKYCGLFALFLISAIMEVTGYSYVLPSAKCDLGMDDSQRGLISSMPYIAVVATSFPWGYLVDTRGRKPILIISSLGVGVFGLLAGFMPDIISFTICKLLGSLCLACPAAAPYAYIGEILPQKYRDIILSVTNALQTLGSSLIPLIAWLILPFDFRINFGLYDFRPWRLLTMAYSVLFLLCAFLMSFGPESPKYLVSQGRYDEAMEVLRNMYAGNHGTSPDKFPVSKLKVKQGHELELHNRKNQSFLSSVREQTVPLLKPPYIKWMTLNGFLLFGIFSTLNGLFMWVPDVLNRVLSGSTGGGMTACEVIGQRFNESNGENTTCDDSIDMLTFKINSIANMSCAFITLLASVLLKLIGKKALLVLMYYILGLFAISINFVRQEIVFAILLSSLQVTALGIGLINAYAVEIFPTSLRGMAVSLALMVGRMGSVIGTNVAGILINTACEVTFYLFGGLLLICGTLSFLLPKTKRKK